MLSSASSVMANDYHTTMANNSVSSLLRQHPSSPLINFQEQSHENHQSGHWNSIEYKRFLSSLNLQEFHHRRQTFQYWPIINGTLNFDALARSGFYFSGVGDMVECYACHAMLGNWSDDHNPTVRHRIARRDCSHLARMQPAHADQHTTNVEPLERERFVNPFSSELRDFRRRLNTFVAFRPICRLQFNNEAFCAAGFYATGTRDQVVCWCCGIRLSNFVANDDPWVEHARWSPRCQFVRVTKGQEFIDQVIQQFSSEQTAHPPSSLDSLPQVESGPTRIPSPELLSVEDESIRQVALLNEALEQVHTQRAIEIFGSEIVTEVMERKIERDNCYYHSTEALCDAIIDRQRQTTEADQIVEPSRRNSLSPQISELEARYQEFENERRCKVCLNHRASVVFLDCRHICACASCADRLRTCPVCRSPISRRIQAFFA